MKLRRSSEGLLRAPRKLHKGRGWGLGNSETALGSSEGAPEEPWGLRWCSKRALGGRRGEGGHVSLTVGTALLFSRVPQITRIHRLDLGDPGRILLESGSNPSRIRVGPPTSDSTRIRLGFERLLEVCGTPRGVRDGYWELRGRLEQPWELRGGSEMDAR